jgi:exopolysaccharide biosynthesis polyprenyl glycosylphosphotransferase
MNKFEIFFSVVMIPVDFLAIVTAGILAYLLRTSDTVISYRRVFFDININEYVVFVSIFAVLTISSMALSGLYEMTITRRILREFITIFQAVSTVVLIIVLWQFFVNRDFFSSRFIFLALWIFSALLIFAFRMILVSIQKLLAIEYGLGIHRVAIIGVKTNPGQMLSEALTHQNIHGYTIVNQQDKFNEGELLPLIQAGQLDEVIVCGNNLDTRYINNIGEFCDEYKIAFQYTPNFNETHTNIDVRDIAGLMVFRVKRTTLEGWGKVMKRVFDILFAVLFLVIFSPVYIIVALAVKLDSPGPILYKNKRVGEGSREFYVYKFRSMYIDDCTTDNNSEALKKEQELIAKSSIKAGPIYKIKNDPRVTKVGAFIRKTSLDELPQFFNVLQGNMSIVGPRPHQPREVEKYERKHKRVLTVKPGITGLAQVNGRSDLSFEEEILFDTFYIENWTLLWDIIIILKTPFAMLSKRQVD